MKQLVKELKKLLNKQKEIVDFIIFGSTIKGNIKKNDLDLAVLTREKIKKKELKDKIEKITKQKIDLQIITIEDYNTFLWVTLIREGFSVKHNKYLFELYKIKPKVLYKYSLKELTPSKKVMFDRAIKSFKGIDKLSNRVVLVPVKISGEFNDFLRTWNLDIDTQEYGLLPLVRKGEF